MPVLEYTPRGASARLFRCRDREVVLSGPAGTGKSRSVGEYLLAVAEQYAGARILVVRKTRKSLTDSWMVTFEERVLWPTHPVLARGIKRANRHSYDFPNGSTIVCGGLDEPTRYYSTEWDLVYVNECTEVVLDEWERFLRSLRNGKVPWQQLIGDCNPDAPNHWILQRANAGVLTLMESRHEDNPLLYDHETGEWTQTGADYIRTLDALTGVRKERLRYGRWVSAEGMIWSNFSPTTHQVGWDKAPLKHPGRPIGSGPQECVFDHYVAGVDWGFRNPGVIELFGVDGDGRMYRVVEIYRVEKTIDWWVEQAKRLQAAYGVAVWACDPSEPDYIERFRKAGLNAVAANNAKKPGFDAVRDRLAVAADGRPRLMFLRDALESTDPLLAASKRPTCFEDEVWGFVYRKTSDGQAVKEEEDPGCDDHACDAVRYAVMEEDAHPRKGVKPKPQVPTYAPGTAGDILGHAKVWAKIGKAG